MKTAIGTGATAVIARGKHRCATVGQKFASVTIVAGAQGTLTRGIASLADDGVDGKSGGNGSAAGLPKSGVIARLLVGALALLAGRRRKPLAG